MTATTHQCSTRAARQGTAASVNATAAYKVGCIMPTARDDGVLKRPSYASAARSNQVRRKKNFHLGGSRSSPVRISEQTSRAASALWAKFTADPHSESFLYHEALI